MNPRADKNELQPLPPDQWLTANELAAKFALSHKTPDRWVNDGVIPERFTKCGNGRHMLFHPAVVTYLEEVFSSAHR